MKSLYLILILALYFHFTSCSNEDNEIYVDYEVL